PAFYAACSSQEQLQTSIEGVESNGSRLQAIHTQFDAMAAWIGHPNVYFVKLEDLVGAPGARGNKKQAETLRHIAAFLGIHLDDIMLDVLQESLAASGSPALYEQIGSWKRALTAPQLVRMQVLMGDRLLALGYEAGSAPPNAQPKPAPAKLPERPLQSSPVAQDVRPAPRHSTSTYQGENLLFLISQPRAGSTLMQRVLGSHEAIHALAEPWVMLHPLYARRSQGIQTNYDANLARAALDDFVGALPGGWEDYMDGIRAMAGVWYNKVLTGTGKPLFLDKTPRYYHIIPDLAALFPAAKLMIQLRNPLAVLSSVLTTWVGKNWSRLSMHRDDILLAPARIAEALHVLGDRLITIRYETFVQDPDAEMLKLCSALGLRFNPEMLNYGANPAPPGRMGDSIGVHQHNRPQSGSLDKWKNTFTNPTYRLLAEIVLTLTGPEILSRLGYSFEGLYEQLLQLPMQDAGAVGRDQMIAMVAALQLSPENVERITPLMGPYLTGEQTATHQSLSI
ncbi:MAG: sulfotransferase, partial [Bacteroidota bacterium]